MSGDSKLVLEVTLDAVPLPVDVAREVHFSIAVENRGSQAAAIYSDLSGLQREYGPALSLTPVIGGQLRPDLLVELRRNYGPPGIPPRNLARYLAERIRPVAPGSQLTSKLDAFWIPKAQLPAEALRLEVLDPMGIDGLAQRGLHPEGAAGALVFEVGASMADEMRERVDFLRPPEGVHMSRFVLFVPQHEPVSLRFGYQHFKDHIDGATSDCALQSPDVPLRLA